MPVPEQAHRLQVTDFLPPQTALEELIAEMWRDLLNVDQIGLHDNFFELGGHSLLVTQVILRHRKILEFNLPLRTLFEHQTLAQFARETGVQLTNAHPDWPSDKSATEFDILTP